jgi:hypothetical protein
MTWTSDPTPPTAAGARAGMVDYLLLSEVAAATEVHLAEPVLILRPERSKRWVRPRRHRRDSRPRLDRQAVLRRTRQRERALCHGLEYHPERPGQPLAGQARATVVYEDRTRRELGDREAQRLAVHHLPAITAALRAHDNRDSQVLATLLTRRYGWAPRRWHHEALRAVDRLDATS